MSSCGCALDSPPSSASADPPGPPITWPLVAERALIKLKLTLDGEPAASETRFTWAGPYILCLHTVIPQGGLALELHSAFVGHEGVETHVAHVLLGPAGQPPAVHVNRHEHENVDPTFEPRTCVYEHTQYTQYLIEALQNLGWHASLNVADERVFAGLEQGNAERS